MTVQINMKKFVETGEFGAIKLGMSRDEVREILGEPPMWGMGGNFDTATIWQYGSIEFYFPKPNDEDNMLWMIYSDHLPIVGTEVLEIDAWILSPELSLPEADKHLEAASIPYSKKVHEKRPDALIEVSINSGIVLNFHKPDPRSELNPDGHFLTGLGIKREIERTPQKQISVSIPLHLYEKLRKISVKQSISMSKIASQWLTAYLEQMPHDE